MNNDLDQKGEELRQRLAQEARATGYNLNPDLDMTSTICAGLAKNEGRYGYMSCPCRLASGKREEDKDIICPCDYRDSDLAEYGSCYCALYVSGEIVSGKKKAAPVPERRPPAERRLKAAHDIQPLPTVKSGAGGAIKVWRCKVCGYLCAKETPPAKCPICKADKDRFEEFAL
ncbi:MAG: ferredoxin:glutaredoxin reductase [Elusimicrobia bacterium]|nr:ferredoxin:glutaredoxin reductase [Elusimicrobiota bacterium]